MSATERSERDVHQRGGLPLLMLTAIGIVYGDIGTSPLYAIRECFHGPHAVNVSDANVLGVLSLVFWTVVLVVTVKYTFYILRADNGGEGGVLALMAVAVRGRGRAAILTSIGLFGAALLYGDGMITPAISVLSAIEGLEVATPVFSPFVIPITIVILIGLFAFQHKGTAGIGKVFGPIVLVWFSVLAVLGIVSISKTPLVLRAVSPTHAVTFFIQNGPAGYLVLGAVFLVATGAEALYADLGHFGTRPIRIDWVAFVAPALLLNYFGQGALLLRSPAAADNPFYRMAPDWALYPLVVLAAIATVIASQAVISGVFSLTRQAIQLGFAPRMKIVHTSPGEIGQIYMPGVNWGLLFATISLVLGFRSSSNLAAAYGVAVTTTMIITTVLAFVVATQVWKWPVLPVTAMTILFLAVDVSFFGANVVKIAQGGWFPLLIASIVFTLFTTWRWGRRTISRAISGRSVPPGMVIDDVGRRQIARVSGTAVFLTSDPETTPTAFLHNIKHNRVVHQRNLFLTVTNRDVPYVSESGRIDVDDLGHGFYRIVAHYGFVEDPDVPGIVKRVVEEHRVPADLNDLTYVMSRSTVASSRRNLMTRFRDLIFVVMSRNALNPVYFFQIPPNRVIELGLVHDLAEHARP